jgi:hypothetical protein
VVSEQRPDDRDSFADRPASGPAPASGPVPAPGGPVPAPGAFAPDALGSGANSAVHGLLWTQAIVEGTRRAQAALAAGALRQLGAPVMEALARHRELAAALGDTAEQMGRMASHVKELAKQHDAVTAQLQVSMEPYLRYIDWLDREADAPPAGG